MYMSIQRRAVDKGDGVLHGGREKLLPSPIGLISVQTSRQWRVWYKSSQFLNIAENKLL